MRLSPLRTISGRIVLGFVVLVATFGGVSIYTVLRMRQFGGDLRFANTAYLEVSLNVAQLYTLQDRIVDHIEERADKGDLSRGFIKQTRQKCVELLTTSRDQLAALRDVREAQRIDNVEKQISERLTMYEQTAPFYDLLFDPKATPEARKAALAQVANREGKLRDKIKQLSNLLRAYTLRYTASLEQAEEQSRVITIVLGTLAAFVGLLTALGAVLTLRPLGRLRDGVRKVARGDYRERVKVPGSTEVAEVAREFNAMAAALAAREAELIRSERLAVVGKMAAVITHEVRNPLSSIGLNTELLAEEVSGSPEAAALCRAIQKEVDRLTGITEDYLRFARMPRPKLEREQVNAIVSGLMEFQREELAQRGVLLSADLASDLPVVAADEAQLRQAFLNLVKNAADAMGDAGGELTVKTSAASDGSVEVRVADTGPGITSDVIPRIFEPFFSTKEGGTGLGLALTHQIILEHGGRIDVESAPGKGTTFVVRLPAAREIPAPAT